MRVLQSAIAGLVVLAITVPAHAQERPCAVDVQKFCSQVAQGGGRIAACLKEHAAELSDACKEKIGKVKAEMKEVRDACKDDREKFCKDVKPGQGAIIKCMRAHKDELSPACKDSLKDLRKKHQGAAKAPSAQAPASNGPPAPGASTADPGNAD